MSEDKHLRNARDPEQTRRMQILKEHNLCYLCETEQSTIQIFPCRIYEGELWYITPNDFKKNGEVHLYMIVPKRHVENFGQLTIFEAAELPRMVRWLQEHLNVDSFSIYNRNGRPEMTGGTLPHCHVQFVVGIERPEKCTLEDAIPIVLGYRPRQQK